jgi:hypothetical protein
VRIEELEVFVKPDGTVSIDVRGVKGRKCLDVTRDLELDLGGEVLLREECPEMFETEAPEELHARTTAGK